MLILIINKQKRLKKEIFFTKFTNYRNNIVKIQYNIIVILKILILKLFI